MLFRSPPGLDFQGLTTQPPPHMAPRLTTPSRSSETRLTAMEVGLPGPPTRSSHSQDPGQNTEPDPHTEPEPHTGPGPGPGLMSKLKSKVVKCLGEFPRSFSALSAYRDLTFVFSRVVWALIINCEETGGSEQPVNNITCIQSAEPAERWNSHSDDPDPSVGPSPGKRFACTWNSLGDGLDLHN